MRFFLAFAAFWFITSSATADNWDRFRGPNGSGVAQDSGIPSSWTDKDLAWKINLPGRGHSSPVIWDDTVYVTSADSASKTFSLLAVRASDGGTKWKREYPFEPRPIHVLNSHASSTPAVDENGIYALWFDRNQSIAVATDHSGGELWRRDLGSVFGQHGPTQSPMIHKGKLVFSLEHELNYRLKSYWYALDLTTGEIVWKLERETSESASSSVPCVYQSKSGKEWLVFASRGHGISAVDPETGRLEWEEKHAFPARVVCSPILFNDLILATCGEGSIGLRLTAVRPGDRQGADSEVVHSIEERYVPYVPTPIALDGKLYLFQDRGYVSCVDLESGGILWSERPGGKFFGSPVLVEGRLYCINTKGQVVVLKAGSQYELLGVNDLGEPSKSTPAVAGGRMILRTESHLSCIAVTK
jgi:outer membrane protein assembly factor BamB